MFIIFCFGGKADVAVMMLISNSQSIEEEIVEVQSVCMSVQYTSVVCVAVFSYFNFLLANALEIVRLTNF